MPNRKTHDVVATVGEYTDRNGEKKKRYLNVGSAFTDDQGRISIKLEALPVGKDWSGYLSLYPPKEQDQGRSRQQQRPAPQQEALPMDDPDEEIPF